MRLQRRIQLVLDDAGLHPCHPAYGIDPQDLVEMPGEIHGDAPGEGLPVGARAPAPRRNHHPPVLRPGEQLRECFDVCGILREDHGLGQPLIDRIVCGQNGAVRVLRCDFAPETLGGQCLEKTRVVTVQRRRGGNDCNQFQVLQ